MPKVGDVYVYEGEQPIGRGNEGLAPGTEVTVRDVVPAAMPGAHTDDEDSVVITWEAAALVRTVNGNEVGSVNRAISVSSDIFTSDFKKKKGA